MCMYFVHSASSHGDMHSKAPFQFLLSLCVCVCVGGGEPDLESLNPVQGLPRAKMFRKFSMINSQVGNKRFDWPVRFYSITKEHNFRAQCL